MGFLGSVFLLGFIAGVLGIIAVSFCISTVVDARQAARHSRLRQRV